MTGTRVRAAVGLLGVTLLVVVVTGHYRSYVRASNWWMLLAAGVVLVVLAVHGALREWQQLDLERSARRYAADPRAWLDGRLGTGRRAPGSGHDHDGPGSAWVLLLAPVACLALLAPPTLGSYSAARAPDGATAALVPAVTVEGPAWAPLPAGDVVPMTFQEFVVRARWDTTQAMAGRTVRLTGFVVPRAPERAGEAPWVLARMGIMCCAADAVAYRVRLSGAPVRRLPADTWLEVEGMWVAEPAPTDPDAPGAPPLLRVTALREVPVPAEPFDG